MPSPLQQYLKEIQDFNPSLDPKRTYNEGLFLLAKDFSELSGIDGFQLSIDFLPTIQQVLPWATAAYRNDFSLKVFDTFPLFEELNENERAAVTILAYSISEPYDRIYCEQNMHLFEASLMLNSVGCAFREYFAKNNIKPISQIKPTGYRFKVPSNKSELYPKDLQGDANFYHESLRIFRNIDIPDNPEWHAH